MSKPDKIYIQDDLRFRKWSTLNRLGATEYTRTDLVSALRDENKKLIEFSDKSLADCNTEISALRGEIKALKETEKRRIEYVESVKSIIKSSKGSEGG